MLRWILYSPTLTAAQSVIDILDKRRIGYRLELSDAYEDVSVQTPAGRFSGFQNIEEAFGFRDSSRQRI